MIANQTFEWSPRMTARVAGLFYLVNIVAILSAAFVFRGLSVAGDMSATAHKLPAHETLFRLAVAAEIVSTVCSLAVAALLYELLRPVSRGVSLAAAFLRVTACGIAILGYVLQLARLHILTAAPSAGAFGSAQSGTLALLLRRMNGEILDISIVFFGCTLLVLGMLIVASKFLPRGLGLLVGIAGLLGLTFLAPRFANPLFPYFAGVGLLAEMSLALWLTLRGVNVERWNERVAARALRAALAMTNGHAQPTIRDAFVYSVASSA